eukprot:6212067-Pleurochrysis_carterae.AAC.2
MRDADADVCARGCESVRACMPWASVLGRARVCTCVFAHAPERLSACACRARMHASTHARTHTRTHAHTHARHKHARTHARTRARTHGMDVLSVVPISRSAAAQRAGRAGRTASGEV